MRIQLSEILLEDGQPIHREFLLDRKFMQIGDKSFALSGKSVAVLDITHTGGQVIQIKGSVQASARIPCGRCLEETETFITLSVLRKVDMKELGEEGARQWDGDPCVVGTELDVEQLAYHELLLQWPMKVLCKEDCKGLCSRCGTNLNHHACDCGRTGLDPRMAAISDIFSKYKEV